MNSSQWVITGFLIVCGIAVLAGTVYVDLYAPPAESHHWNDLSDHARQEVLNIVEPLEGESFKYFYSLALMDFKEDGNLVTNKRVVSYFTEDEEFYIQESRYNQMVDFDVVRGDDFLNDTVITINHEDIDEDFDLYFAVSGGLDKEITSYIKGQIQAQAPKSKSDE